MMDFEDEVESSWRNGGFKGSLVEKDDLSVGYIRKNISEVGDGSCQHNHFGVYDASPFFKTELAKAGHGGWEYHSGESRSRHRCAGSCHGVCDGQQCRQRW